MPEKLTPAQLRALRALEAITAPALTVYVPTSHLLDRVYGVEGPWRLRKAREGGLLRTLRSLVEMGLAHEPRERQWQITHEGREALKGDDRG